MFRCSLFTLCGIHHFINGNRTPYFELRNLNSGVGYNVFLIAQNAKGRSNSTVRQVFTLNNPEKQTDTSSLLASTPAIANIKSLLPLLSGCAGSVVLMAIIILVIVRIRKNRDGGGNNGGSNNTTNGILSDSSMGGSSNDRAEIASYALNAQRTLQSSQEVGLVRDLCTESIESMEKNPDIIPQGKIVSCERTPCVCMCVDCMFISCVCLYVYSCMALSEAREQKKKDLSKRKKWERIGECKKVCKYTNHTKSHRNRILCTCDLERVVWMEMRKEWNIQNNKSFYI